MRIVVLDGYTINPGDISWDELRKLGDVEIYDRTKPEDIVERAKGAFAVMINKTPLTRKTLEALPELKYIGELATGYNQVDIEAAADLGITVTNIPTYGTQAVAQHTFALLLAMTIRPEAHFESVKAGKWSTCPDYSYWLFQLTEIAGKTMGIIGYGRIGQTVGKIAQAFGMKVLAYDSYKDLSLENENMRYVELDELYRNSDVISLHVPLFESNRGIINKDSIARMKDGVKIINTSRGPLVVDQDLADALNCGKVAAAGLDVLSQEPPVSGNPLFKAKNVLITPHIAWAPVESRNRLMTIGVANFRSFIEGNPVNVVNKRQ